MASEPKIEERPAQREAGALLLQHLEEAHATEQALVTNLRAHIAMTPRGSYRASLERHLTETAGARAGRRPPDPRDRPQPRPPQRRLRRADHRRRPGDRAHQGPARPRARRPPRRGEAAQERPRRGRHRGARDRHLRRHRGARQGGRRRADGQARGAPPRPGGADARRAAAAHPAPRHRGRAGARRRQPELRLGDDDRRGRDRARARRPPRAARGSPRRSRRRASTSR